MSLARIMKYLIALAAVTFTLSTATTGLAQARDAAQTGATTSGAKSQPPVAKSKPKPKAKAKATAKPKKATAKPKPKPKPKKKTATASPSAASTATTTTNGTTTAGTTGTPNITTSTPTIQPVRNAKLEARLQPLLPNGTNVTDAAKGFRNWGRFVAAVHASNNLNIPFRTLKAKMTGDMPLSLGQAIQAIQSGTKMPTTMNSRTSTTASAVTQAEQQAAEDFRRVRDDSR
jgi:hypothetical protein